MEWDSVEEIIGRYRQAVKQNINQTRVVPPPDRVYVQSMPEIQRYGELIIPTHRPEDFVDDLNMVLYGTVLAIGEDVTDVCPGDDVAFTRKFGVKFGGVFNPLRLKDESSRWEDMIRIFTVSAQRCELMWKVSYDYLGKRVRYRRPSGIESTAMVHDESIVHGGSMKVRDEDTGDYQWISTDWVVEVLS